MALTFEWNAHKAAANLAKHGVSFDEAVTAFADHLGRLENDDRHSVSEAGLALLGRSSSNRLLAVMFPERGAERIRLISARQATRSERRQ
jgi:hypothetical protein